MRCNECNESKCSPCGGGCDPVKYSCSYSIEADPYDPNTWIFDECGVIHRVKVPEVNEHDTKLTTSYVDSMLNYTAEKHTDKISGQQLGSLINVKDLRDTNISDIKSCQLMVFNPHCGEGDCGSCISPSAKWENYSIPNAGDCVMDTDKDGYYRVLVKDDCGCIRECRLPVVPHLMSVSAYIRDSVPFDPDFPWYYGQYNDTINLYLKENAPEYFGKYDLEVTVHYGIQVVRPDASINMNFRSIVCPFAEGETPDIDHMSSILQDDSTYSASNPQIPWGSKSLRGSFTFIVPKGKEGKIHHEFRLRSTDSFPNYKTSPYDGQRVPTEIASQVDKMVWTASRLNALNIVVRPTNARVTKTPIVDIARDQLDPAVDL